MSLRTLLRTVACVTILSLVAFAQSAPPTADTFSNSGAHNQNYGSQTALVVQHGSDSYLKFNLATLPSGVSVSKATLRLYVDVVTSNGSFDVYQLNNSWNEGTLTYNNAPSLGTSATGGHPVSVTSSSLNQFVVVDITSLVQGWANGSIPNNGVALALTSNNGAFAFDSKESIYTSHQPELEIALNGPAGPAGPAGPPGAQGPGGPAGPIGPSGPQGQTGATGPQGVPGPQGPAGQIGPLGPQGPQGPVGPIGATGPQGQTGPQGPAGSNGTGFNFTGAWNSGNNYNSDDVATYDGSTYVATAANQNQQPDQNPNSWTLMAQEGATGQAGPAGPAGAQGPAGPAGPMGQTGAQGPAGPMGAQGAQGPIGPNGPAGPTGPQGPPGINGSSGQGFNFRSAFNNNTSYNPYDVVTYNGSTYVATAASNGPNNPPPNQNSAAWNLETTGFNFAGAWSQGQNYYPDDVVTYNGSTYEALAAIPANGNAPDQNPNWTLLAQQGATGQAGAQGPAGPAGPQGPEGPQGPPGTLSPGSPYYIQNGSGTQTSTSFNIDGNGTVGGTLAGNVVNSTTGYQIGGTNVLSGSGSDQNLFAGAEAGANHVSGTGNVFAGFQAGYNSTNGTRNVFVGSFAGSQTGTNGGNVYVGYASGEQNNGPFNIAIGYAAGAELTSGTYNLFEGYLAGFNNTQSNSDIYLGNRGCASPCTENNTIRIGSDVDQGNGTQTATYIAGVNGAATSGGVPVFVDSNGKLGTTGGSLTFTELTGNLPSSDFTGTYSNAVNLSSSGNTFNGNFNATSNYQINGNSVLSTGNFASNAYVGLQAGLANTQGAGNAFVGEQAGANNNSNFNTFLGYQAGYNNTTGSSDVYLGNIGCASPCAENNTIRIGNQGTGSNQQNTTYIAGVTGSTVSNASPVYVDPNGQVGTSSNRFQWIYYTFDVPANTAENLYAACSAPYPYLVSGSCGANTFNSAVFKIIVDYSGPNTGSGGSNNPSYQNNPNTWECTVQNTDQNSSHTVIYGALCSN